jgi:lipooligosaccharide transport system ATP-binding protein
MYRTTDASVIVAQDVTKWYGALKAVDGLSFEVKPGTCFGLLGPNGAGKSTMMKMIYGKVRRNLEMGGILTVFGYDPNHDALSIKALTGLVPQEDILDSELDVLTNMLLYTKFYGLAKKTALTRIRSLLEFMELDGKAHARIRELSGGMKRRLVLARSLLNEPRLLILDEPTNGLDPQVRHLIWDRLHQLRASGTTILLSTHYMDEAYQLCDELIIMDKGKAILRGNPRELVGNTIERYALQVFNLQVFGLQVFSTSAPNTIRKETIGKKVRIEEAGGMIYIYADDIRDLEGIAGLLTSRDYVLRQTNLEDLFLRATGKGLNDEQ